MKKRSNSKKRFDDYLDDRPSGYNRHHRKPSSRGGGSEKSNISIVPIRHHNAYNLLFGSNPLPHEVAKTLTKTWISPDYEIICRKKGEKLPDDGQLHLFHEPKHDCSKCPNHQLRQTLNPLLAEMAKEALNRAFKEA